MYTQHAYTVDVCGKAWSNNMYVMQQTAPDGPSHSVQPSREESMAAVIPLPDGHTPPPIPLVVLLVHHVGEGGDTASTAAVHGTRKEGSSKAGGLQQDGVKVTREIEVGCVRTALVKKVPIIILKTVYIPVIQTN